ncbi:hypothetical protein PNK_0579 [Candidatus Protochlamydia naegleriophila]|uniref:Membrane dipeptidase n=1 Tax=Candidatus Protochlamydia naegleriophila TaxID=389348 RepID=A0A0U5JCT8_9BACT|nr:membrane dipeptidase [Candidatus Protochlamydia naegleriophila]CUI16207.1 hypothetical protein PNK_0579 [Candidatus Protochlamydia naegleriophila]
MIPVADLHCDLLCYLEENPARTPYDSVVRCSFPQLMKGHVKLQTLANFTHTGPLSVKKGMAQVQLYRQLALLYPKDVKRGQMPFSMPGQTDPVALLMAFENASGFCGEEEPLKDGINRLQAVIRDVGKPLYISLTWNTENRFGGGALTNCGLKEDGKRLLEELNGQGIAIDLSHASDPLAYEMIDYIENKGLDIPLMASHSNARAIKNVPRNLPTDIAKELFRRRAIVGLNLYGPFVGLSEEAILQHLAFWLELGGEKYMCFGSDFFYEGDFSTIQRVKGQDLFFKRYPDASCYPALIEFIRKELKLSESIVHQLAYQNAVDFLNRLGAKI